MKQHITNRQFRELNEKQLNILDSWLVKKGYDIGIPEKGHGEEESTFSIGMMIEFLDDCERWVTIEKTNSGWSLFEDPTGVFEKPDLCDALWESVKETLNKHVTR